MFGGTVGLHPRESQGSLWLGGLPGVLVASMTSGWAGAYASVSFSIKKITKKWLTLHLILKNIYLI